MPIETRVIKSSTTGVRAQDLTALHVDSVTWKLNDIHSAKVSVHPLEPNAAQVTLNDMELAIVLGNDFSNIFQGIPVNVSGNVEKITFDLESVISYMDYAYIVDPAGGSLSYPNTEQLNIATQLVTYAQAATFADRAIQIGTYSGSGVFRDRTYLGEEYLNIYELLKSFTELDNGFDWDVVIASDGTRRFTPYYPRKGSLKNQYRMDMDKGGMSRWMGGLVDWREGGGENLTDVIFTGPSDPVLNVKMRGRYQAASGAGQPMTKYGRRQRVFSDTAGGATTSWLTAKATAVGLDSLDPHILPKIRVSDELFGLLVIGDSFPLYVDYGRIQIAGEYRVVELTITPDSGWMDVTLQEV